MGNKGTKGSDSDQANEKKEIKRPKMGSIVKSFMIMDSFYCKCIPYQCYYGCDSIHKCQFDKETKKYLLESCKYYLHRLECCWNCCDKEDKSEIQEMSKAILEDLTLYYDEYIKDDVTIKEEISKLKKHCEDVFELRKAEDEI